MSRLFNIAEDHKPRAGLTISWASGIQSENSITFFSLGAGTDPWGKDTQASRSDRLRSRAEGGRLWSPRSDSASVL